MPAHKPNESIEGLNILGYSRDPLRSKPTRQINGKKCFLFKAEFNVSAEIIESLVQGTMLFDGNALIATGERIGCDSALITTFAKTRTPKQKLASNVTATHSANMWEFNQQTNVKVVTPRQSIINALQKRNNALSLNNSK